VYSSILLAQSDEPLEIEPVSDVAELLTDNIDNEFLSLLILRLVSPGLSMLIILVAAAILSSLAKRLINNIVGRMKDPELATARRGLRRRVGLAAEDRQENLRRVQRADALGALASSITKVVIWSMALIMALGQVGVQLAPLIAGAGIIGVAVGFGAQDLVKDFLSGVFMLIEDQYGLGDIVDVGEASGVVEGISLRSTRIRDVEGTLWHVPNGEIRRVGNSSQDWARALVDIGVAYGTDIDAASDIIGRVAVEMSHEAEFKDLFLDEPDVWGVQALGADSVDIRLVIKVVPGKQWAIMRELRARIKKAFDSAEIEIPYPQRTVWLRTEQPVALGDSHAERFHLPVPDEDVRQRAVDASKVGSAGKMVDDLEEATPDELEETAADPLDPTR
jgi:small conductance mechanosensitive channel